MDRKRVRMRTTRPLARISITAANIRPASMITLRKSFVIAQVDPTDQMSSTNLFECNLTRIMRYFRPKNYTKYTAEEFEKNVDKLHRYCLTHLIDSYRMNINRVKGVALLDEILDRAKYQDLSPRLLVKMIWCIASCIHYFAGKLRGEKTMAEWLRRRQYKKSIRAYEKLLDFVMPDTFSLTLHSLSTFITEANVWSVEFFCIELLKRLLIDNSKAEETMDYLLNLIEGQLITNVKTAKQILRILCQMMEKYIWEEIDEETLGRVLSMYHHSIQPSMDDLYNYVPLRRGLEVLIRNVFENLTNFHLMKCLTIMLQWTFDEKVSDEALLDLGNVIEYAALLHDTQNYRESLPLDTLPLILRLVASENLLHSLLGNRVLQHLLDRRFNRLQFDTPKIFLQDTHFNVEIAKYNSNDKYFIRRYREMLHTTLLAAVAQHGMHRIHLENVYTSIAILVVEVPCGYTAAAVVCLAMAIQDYALSDDTLELEPAHRLHATVMSILSLICWVHNAKVFYDYLNVIMSRRAQFAPHLNPPLRPTYSYAQHHILWNKPELFFEDWEVRYGLWKCFRGRRRTRLAIKST